MQEAGLTDIRTSILKRQNTVAQYIATRPLLDLCEGARAREVAKVPLRWWDQAGIDWKKAKAKGLEWRQTGRTGREQTRKERRSGRTKAGQAVQAGRNGAGRVQMSGHES